jgi:hypothetical protein
MFLYQRMLRHILYNPHLLESTCFRKERNLHISRKKKIGFCLTLLMNFVLFSLEVQKKRCLCSPGLPTKAQLRFLCASTSLSSKNFLHGKLIELHKSRFRPDISLHICVCVHSLSPPPPHPNPHPLSLLLTNFSLLKTCRRRKPFSWTPSPSFLIFSRFVVSTCSKQYLSKVLEFYAPEQDNSWWFWIKTWIQLFSVAWHFSF